MEVDSNDLQNCANCRSPCFKTNFLNNDGDQNATYSVTRILSEIYNLNFLLIHDEDNDDMLKQENFNDDDETFIICEKCGVLLGQLYELYQSFNSLRVLDSLLDRKIRRLDKIMEKQQQQLPSSLHHRAAADLFVNDSTMDSLPEFSDEIEINSQDEIVPVNNFHHRPQPPLPPPGPWVKLRRLTKEEITSVLRRRRRNRVTKKKSYGHIVDDPDVHFDLDSPSRQNSDVDFELDVDEVKKVKKIGKKRGKYKKKGDSKTKPKKEKKGKVLLVITDSNNSCPVCAHACTSPADLTQHLLHTHTRMGHRLCPICHKSFKKRTQLESHLNYHTGYKPFCCSMCSKASAAKSELKNHMWRIHKMVYGASSVSSSNAGSQIESSTTTTDGTTTAAADLECDQKDDTVQVNSAIPPGVRKSAKPQKSAQDDKTSKNKDTGYNCLFCESPHPTSIELADHFLTQHVFLDGDVDDNSGGGCDLSEKTCPLCNHPFVGMEVSVVKLHLDSHAREHPEKCEICDKILAQAWMTTHKKIHGEEFKCIPCEQTFTTQARLESHQRHRHQETRVIFCCSKCGRPFVYEPNMKRHEEKCNVVANGGEKKSWSKSDIVRESTKSGRSLSEWRSKKSEICTICSKRFKTKKILDVHQKRMHQVKSNPMSCPECHKVLSGQAAYYQHMARHNGVKSFMCHVCGAAFLTKGELKMHSIFHDDFRPFLCSHCALTFKTRSLLNRHVKSHTNERNYVCNVCGKGFNMPQVLKAHTRTHATVKDHLCQLCGKSFAEKRTMRRHLETHAKNGEVITYESFPN